MEARRFDTVVKALGTDSTRRRMLRGLLGGALGVGALGTVASQQGAAAPNSNCACQYACGDQGLQVLCVSEISCPDIGRYRGADCQNLHQLECGIATKGECKKRYG